MNRRGANNTYWGNIREGVSSMVTGLKLSFKHILEARESRTPVGVADPDYFKQETGIVTLQYPHESIPVPDNGRYRLHNEIEDCIVCDKCAKICPVNCIEIEPVRAVEEIGKTSDGSSKRIYPAKFDIDMGKCCFCGLCTTVCPTECLTMTKEYDFSEFDVVDHNYAFSEMTPLEILEKKQELETFMEQKKKAKAAASDATTEKPAGAAKPKIGAKPKAAGYRPKAASARPKPRPVPKTKKTEEGTQAQDKPTETPQETARRIMEAKKKKDAPSSDNTDDTNKQDG